ncbi:hypothetical protein H4V97_001503 [Flavobacterium sp. CG_23.5]|uniref:SusD/RagB family nutrient-binding outer membrane lipoprotein n=1 Tax=unclassified Flavobacterium TaxID=196869 RepID=UPI0018CB21C7|nr:MULTISPECIES: SusD/RagB family nutrient-binding outer membrane lipoprotein [unclassified Flavobacterium]MBG6109943.1 hypothetical protein [Flavobacterium sp. CG_9.10]MBP2283185.1 hypothetical protein [Flavobacterium sp. CG_23.5]
MKKIKFILPILALVMYSCNDYLDVNTDPNRLSESQLNPAKLMPASQVGSYRVQATSMNQLGNVFMNTWASNVQSYTGGYSKEFQLTIDNSFYNPIWNNLYLNLNNIQKIIDYPNTSGKYNYSVAAAKIMKAHYMQYIVDLYGNAPFTGAFKGFENLTPAYNDDQFIYRQLLTGLDEARALIAKSDPSVSEDIAGFDVMLHGDMNRWVQFANTIELRMLLRMSNNTGAIATYRNARLTKLASASLISSSVTINPGYSDSNDDQLNPTYGVFFFDSALNSLANRTFITESGHIYKALNAASVYTTTGAPEIIAGSGIFYPNVADPRRTRLFGNGAGQTYQRAVTQGSNVVDIFPTTGAAGLPARLGTGLLNPENAIVASATSDYASSNGYVMTLQEAYFLRAEAALRYPTLFTGASANFDLGVQASFKYLTSTVGTYLTTVNATKPNFGFNVANTFAQNLHAIMYQKWIGLAGIHGIESFIDYNRTGYPLTPLATTATEKRKPRSLIYPISEYIANAANVPVLTAAQIFADSDPSNPFWRSGDPALGN